MKNEGDTYTRSAVYKVLRTYGHADHNTPMAYLPRGNNVLWTHTQTYRHADCNIPTEYLPRGKKQGNVTVTQC